MNTVDGTNHGINHGITQQLTIFAHIALCGLIELVCKILGLR